MPDRSHHRAHLDGLRALAVYLVVLFHAGLARMAGGFIGVDVFFVLSGYLVTQTLLRDLDPAGGGRIRFGRFYARRFRRLLPASAFALVVTAVVYRSAAAPGAAADAVSSFQAAFLYVANWHFIRAATGYFGGAVDADPLLHFWSLAVEEQFYLVWPLLLSGSCALGRRLRRPRLVPAVVVAVGATASLVAALALQGAHPDRAYFGTDTRAYQLGAGALLALAPTAIERVASLGARVRWAAVAGVVALVVLATSAIRLSPIGRGAAATALTIVVIAALDAAPAGPLHRLLSAGPVVYLGAISYGTYLWHWPVIVLLSTVSEPSPALLAAIAVLVASGLAALSARLLEQPVRASAVLDGHRYAVIATGLTISVLGAAVVAPRILERPTTAELAAPESPSLGLTPVPDDLNLEQVAADRFGSTVSCVDRAPSACTVVRGGGPHIMLMGDSNAQMLVPAFEAAARAQHLTLSLEVVGGCPWQRGFYALSTEVRDRCRRQKDDAYQRVIPALDPDVIVLVNVARHNTSIARTRTFTQRSLDELAAPGRTLVLLEPVVEAPADQPPLDCLQDATFLEDCRYVAKTEPSAVDRMYRDEAASRTGVEVGSIDQLVCPYLPICDPVVRGHVVRWDFQHLATGFSASLGPELADWLRQMRVIS